MFKLLKEEEKKFLQREYKLRRLAVILVALSTTFVVGVVAIFPSYILSNTRKAEIGERTRVLDEIGPRGDGDNLGEWLSLTNEKLIFLAPTLDKDRPSEYLKAIIDKRIAGIKIKALSIAYGDSSESTSIIVFGEARDRQTLIDFEDAIKESGHFSNVLLPVSNLARDRDIDFQMKFNPKI